MAMTYQDVLNQIKNAGMENQFSQYDMATAQKYPEFGASMLSIKQDWNNAKDQAGKTAANQAAEALRWQYGSYLGGSDGSKYYGLGPSPGSYQSIYQQQMQEALDRLGNYGSFEYGAAPSYNTRYQQQIDSLLNRYRTTKTLHGAKKTTRHTAPTQSSTGERVPGPRRIPWRQPRRPPAGRYPQRL